MKLSDLRSAIRSTKGNPSMSVTIAGTVIPVVVTQKVQLLSALGDAFDNRLSVETGITFDPETRHLCAENDQPPAATSVADLDLDDLDLDAGFNQPMSASDDEELDL